MRTLIKINKKDLENINKTRQTIFDVVGDVRVLSKKYRGIK